MSTARRIAVLQPGYLPWLGFFDQMVRSDLFIYYDDVQFDVHGWRNRNRIKGPGGLVWLTVPVRHSGRNKPSINEIEIDTRYPWIRKHLGTIAQFYRRAPHFEPYFTELSQVLSQPWTLLVELDLALIEMLRRWLGIGTETHRASSLGIGGERSDRLLDICERLGANTYLSGDAAKDYLDVDLFHEHGISVEWQAYEHPVYSQLHGDFAPYVSVLDLILNVGPESAGFFCKRI